MNKLLAALLLILAAVIIFFSLNIICCTLPSTEDRPLNVVAAELIEEEIQSPSELRTTYSKIQILNDSLDSDTISSIVTALPPNQICVSKGDFEEDSSVILTNTGILFSKADSAFVRLSVICDTGTSLAEELVMNGIEQNWMRSPACQSLAESDNLGCVVALRTE